MLVKELIEELQRHDQNTLVVIDGYEGGYHSVNSVKFVKILGPFEDREWYYGEYTDDCGSDRAIPAVYLPRKIKI
jgi:hypothetical protein